MKDAFAELVLHADRKAHHYVKEARFCAAAQQGYYESSPWSFTYRVPGGNKADTTLNLFYAAGGFTAEHIDTPPKGVRDIAVPLPLGLDEAEKILRDGGIHGVITHIELSWPRFAGVNQPYYAFEVGDDIWFVGLKDRSLRKAPLFANEGEPVAH